MESTPSINRAEDDENGSLPPLEYPRNFFNPVTGASPADEDAAALLWSYRKDRPRKGSTEVEAPDGRVMMAEIESMRASLRVSILKQYFDEARQRANELNLYIDTIATTAVTPKDLKKALCKLECNDENQLIVYSVCHESHRDRAWLAHAVDKWLAEENMVLLPSSDDEVKKKV
jgi:hypothetical protein